MKIEEEKDSRGEAEVFLSSLVSHSGTCVK